MSQVPLNPDSAPAIHDGRAVVPAVSGEQPVDLDNLQGDIYPNFTKKAEDFIFFQIKKPDDFKVALGEFIPHLTPASKVLNKVLPDVQKARIANYGYQRPLPKERYAHVEQFQIAFSHAAWTPLGIKGEIGDADFEAGQKRQAIRPLGDLPTIDTADPLPDWDLEWRNHTLHGVIVTATESTNSCNLAFGLVQKIFGDTIHIVNILRGHVRPEPEDKNEHFGFRDGISLPAINGLVTPHKGQLTCDPGVIILGHEGDSNKDARPDWAYEGSIMAFRKLRQFVPEFNLFLQQNPIEGNSELRGAKMVGRWKSGAPIDKAQHADDKSLTEDPEKINDFNYHDPTPGQDRCPFSAHIRKTAPREQTGTDPKELESHLIMRAGIPYGQEVTQQEKDVNATDKDRGLLFVCYQSSLSKGFKFMQQLWCNNANFPRDETTGGQTNLDPRPGLDPIVGNAVGPNRIRGATGTDPNNLAANLAMPKDFVIARGGEYFWVPSIKTLGRLAAGEILLPKEEAPVA